jgi:hypothetical protein
VSSPAWKRRRAAQHSRAAARHRAAEAQRLAPISAALAAYLDFTSTWVTTGTHHQHHHIDTTPERSA